MTLHSQKGHALQLVLNKEAVRGYFLYYLKTIFPFYTVLGTILQRYVTLCTVIIPADKPAHNI